MKQRINIDINRELWRRLSIRCAELDILKKDAAEEAIRGWIKNTEEGEMETLRWEETNYSDGVQDFPAVFVRWNEVDRVLGETHTGTPEQDQKLIAALVDAGAPEWVQDADSGWVDEYGWGIYKHD